MSILCALGRHRPAPRPRWNEGYYFTTCTRCGRDLVRTPFEGWKVPTGYRVVWSHKPPQSRPSAKLEAEPAPGVESAGAAADAVGDSQPHASESLQPDPAPERDSFASTSSEPSTTGRAGPAAADVSIAEVLRILREEERLALQAGGQDETDDEASMWPAAEIEPATAEPEQAELVEVGDPPVLDLGQLARKNLQDASVEPDPARVREDRGTPEEERQPLVELAADSETIASESGEKPPSDTRPFEPAAAAEPSFESAPIDDFMDEPDPAAGGTDYWPVPSDSAVATTEALDADEAVDDQLSAEEGRAFAWVAAGENERRDNAVEAEQRLILTPPTENELQQTTPALNDDDAEESTKDDGRAAWPSAAPSQVHTPIIGMDGRVRPRDRNRSRMGLRIVIAAIALVAAVIVTRVSGFEAEKPSAARARIPAGLAADRRTEQFNASRAYVAIRLLNCRASPALGAFPLRKLSRGEAVRVLAREPGWASIAHQGRQCWVTDRYLSAEPPL